MELEEYLVQETDASVLKNLSVMGGRLKELKLKVVETEAAYKEAQKEYDYYASSVLPMEMFNAGITSLELADGGRMTYERNYYCQPNKNVADREIIVRWLREQGGDHLIKQKASVDGKQIPLLKDAEIPFTEIDDINTNSLKAFLKDKLGISGGVQQITMDEIPEAMHFYEVGQVTIDV